MLVVSHVISLCVLRVSPLLVFPAEYRHCLCVPQSTAIACVSSVGFHCRQSMMILQCFSSQVFVGPNSWPCSARSPRSSPEASSTCHGHAPQHHRVPRARHLVPDMYAQLIFQGKTSAVEPANPYPTLLTTLIRRAIRRRRRPSQPSSHGWTPLS